MSAEIPADKIPIWKPTSVSGLYLHVPSKRYYSRLTMPAPSGKGKGKRTFRSLKTTVWTVAQIKHGKASQDVLKSRLSLAKSDNGSGTENRTVRTLGDLRAILIERINTSGRKSSTILSRKLWLDRLVANWPGTFETALPNQVTQDFLLRFRADLSAKPFTLKGTKTVRSGYANEVVNQTLSILNMLLQLAKEHHLIFTNPFDEQLTLGGSIWLPKKPKRPLLPSHFDMERVFSFLGAVQNPERYEEHRLKRLNEQAKDTSEFARFLAFSGARWQEAARARWEHVGEKTIMIHGTKSESSVRPVPVVPAMRGLLDEMRRRRAELGVPCKGSILRVKGCLDGLRRACGALGLPKLTHHHLRHYFVTVCIESGVDIPTISRWLGHADGGAQAMKTYGHLRDAHSSKMGDQVRFGGVAEPTSQSSAAQSSAS